MTIFLILIAVIVCAYLAFLARLYLTQAEKIYNPESEIKATPDQAGFDYEDISIKTSDDITLHGWFIPRRDSRRVMLFFHGNTGNISDCVDTINIFYDLGFNTLMFDYRGYGQSEGHTNEKGTYRDAEAAWLYLTKQRGFAPYNIVVLGRSLGAAIASWLVTQHTPAALIIESTFTSAPDVAAEMHPRHPVVRFLTRYQYPVIENIKKIHCPVLVVHSKDDSAILPHHGHKLYDTAREPKQYLEIIGEHNKGYLISGELYVNGLTSFITRHVT